MERHRHVTEYADDAAVFWRDRADCGGGKHDHNHDQSSIVDGIKSTIAQMVSSSSYAVRPTAIYSNPVLLDLIDREMKTEYNVVLNTVEITGGFRVKALSTQAGDLPLIPDWAIPYTGTPGTGTAVLPAYIVTEDLIEYHWLSDPNPTGVQAGVAECVDPANGGGEVWRTRGEGGELRALPGESCSVRRTVVGRWPLGGRIGESLRTDSDHQRLTTNDIFIAMGN